MPATITTTGESTLNVAHLLYDAAQRSPDHVAVVDRGVASSYGDLWRLAASFAEALRAAGVEPGDRVAIFLERNADAAAAYFGVLVVGAIAVIVNETARPRQLEYTLSHSGARLLITSAQLLARQPRQLRTAVQIIDAASVGLVRDVGAGGVDLPAGAARDVVAAVRAIEPLARESMDIAQIIYTSGSTGQPKGVMVTHGNLRSAVEAVTSYLGLGADDRTAGLLPFSSVYGMNQLLCSIHRAGTLVLSASPLPQQLIDILRQEEVTVLAGVPPLWMQLLGNAGFTKPIESLRILQNAGGHLPEPAVRQLRLCQPQARLFLQYGMTEVIRSTYLPPEEVDRRPTSMGRAIPGAEVLVLRDDRTPCLPGEIGELVHRGPTVTLGYWNDPEMTARVFQCGPGRDSETAEINRVGPSGERMVFSGDLVRRDEEGFLYFVGRRDRMIKTLGYRVGPDEVSDIIHASGEVAEVVVVSEPDEQRGERIVAYVVLRQGGSLKRLAEYCGTEMPRYMQPARFEVRDALPRTSSGKHDVNALLAVAAPT